MKSFLILTIICFNTLFLFSQNFEGKIIYQNSYLTKTAGMRNGQWDSLLGKTQEYFIKNGNYKTLSDGMSSPWQLYINKENRAYTKFYKTEIIYWNDCSKNSDEIKTVELNKKAITILGYECDELILTCKSGVQKYYFSSKLAVNDSLFNHHVYGNWAAYLSYAKALPLKMVIETPQFKMESVAAQIVPLKLEDAFFELPKNYPTMEMK